MLGVQGTLLPPRCEAAPARAHTHGWFVVVVGLTGGGTLPKPELCCIRPCLWGLGTVWILDLGLGCQ